MNDWTFTSSRSTRLLDLLQRHDHWVACIVTLAIQDVLVTTKGIKVQDDAAMKAMLHQIVAMLTRMAMKFDGVAESGREYDAGVDYEHRWPDRSHQP